MIEKARQWRGNFAIDQGIDQYWQGDYNCLKNKDCAMNTEWLSVEDIAEELHVTIDTVRGWIREKKLVAYRPGREYRIKREDLNRFLEESRTQKDE